MITDNPRLARKVRDVQIGDQVHFRGYLAEYSHNHGFAFKRGTSTVRNDSGNGACETVYLDDFEILHRGGQPWHLLEYIALAMLAVGVVGWFALPPRMDR
jgi:hypothetical protein